MAINSYTDWILSLQIPWLVGGPVGQAYAKVFGNITDNQADIIRQAVKARMIDLAPDDALPYLAEERGLIQAPGESTADFRVRLKDAWNLWKFAGAALSILTELHYQGHNDVYLIQENGMSFIIQTVVPSNTQSNTAYLQYCGGLIEPGRVPSQVDIAINSDGYLIGSGTPHAQFAISYLGATSTTTLSNQNGFGVYHVTLPSSHYSPVTLYMPDGYYTTAMGYSVKTNGVVQSHGSAPTMHYNATPFFENDPIDDSHTSRFILLKVNGAGIISPSTAWTDIQYTTPSSGFGPLDGYTTDTSSPSTTDMNTIFSIVDKFKPARAQFLGVFYIDNTYSMIGYPISQTIYERQAGNSQIGGDGFVVRWIE